MEGKMGIYHKRIRGRELVNWKPKINVEKLCNFLIIRFMRNKINAHIKLIMEFN